MNEQHYDAWPIGMRTFSRLSVTVKGRPVTVAASASGEGAGDELVVLLHGLGCTRESWDAVVPAVDHRRRWLAIDLPGHGQSAPLPPRQADAIGFHAAVVVELVRQLAPDRVHLVSHSMGTAVALAAAPDLPGGAFITVEGNLVARDCGLISRRIATQSRGTFIRSGFARMRDDLIASPDADARFWGSTWFACADPASIWASAASLVAWCDSGALAERWSRLTDRTYIWGEHTGPPGHLGHLLDGVRVEQIAGVGHFAMIGNPIGLQQAVMRAMAPDGQAST
ncbi:alpha/beta fold hydrolase [Glycomyces sp. MUSA5-2]|uniref:alpha/beta fold hydrolase n=1 Tax=Glycomyces sp. MUSA5-2 TaxID=2053002 RepID=UPI003009E8EB